MVIVLLFLSFAMLWKKTLSERCGNGCLVCSANDICLLCDAANFYIRSGYTCVKKQIDNCEMTLDGTKCFYCKSQYYLNDTLNTCIQSPFNTTNCQILGNATSCKKCAQNYFVDSSGQCALVTKEIPRCTQYKDATHCAVCSKGQLSADQSICEAPPLVENCAFYSGGISCTACVEGMYFNPNKYLIDLRENPTFLKDFYNELTAASISQTYLLNTKTNVCIKANKNCLTYQDYNNCTSCSPGFYLSNWRCLLNPVEAISHCLKYSDVNVCVQCRDGYYLADPKSCVLQKSILNCKAYSTSTEGFCSECENAFYFNELLKECNPRITKIDHCAKWVWNKQLCEVCKENFLVSSKQNKCYEKISKCTSYLFIESSEGFDNIICNACLSGFYVKTSIENSQIVTKCELVTALIDGCEFYESNTICNSCQNNFFLSNFKCHPHETKITSKLSCKSYSKLLMNTCANCDQNEFLFQIYNYCEKVTTSVVNCESYDSNQKCVKCVDPYYLSVNEVNAQICVKTKIANCLKIDKDVDKCLQCDLTQNLIPSSNTPNNSCVKIPSYAVSSCEKFSANVDPYSLVCSGCAVPFYSKNYNNPNYQFCVAETELLDFKSKLTSQNKLDLSNCNSFDFNSKRCLICDQKSERPYISSDLRLCVQTCNFEDEVILTFDFVGISPSAYFACKGISSIHMWGENTENCRRVDYDVSYKRALPTEAVIEQWCAECKSGTIPLALTTFSYNYTHYDYLPLSHLSNSISSNSYFSSLIKKPLYFSCIVWEPNTMATKTVIFSDLTFKKPDGAFIDYYTTNSVYFAQNWDKFEFCRVVINFKTALSENYACGACKFGYTGIVIHTATNQNFVHTCSAMSDCDTNYYFSGIGSHSANAMLDFIVSCHVCKDANKIVTLANRQPWSIIDPDSQPPQTLNANFATKGYFPYINCYPPGLTTLNGEGFPSKCMIQQLVPDRKLQKYTVDFVVAPNPACIACAPMYSALISDSNIEGQTYPYIKSCDKILNCKSSNTFNACEECESNFVLEYSNVRGLSTGSRCVANSMEGCKIGEENGKCYSCAPGYILNLEGICDDAVLDKCVIKGTTTTLTSAFDYLTTNPFGQGCLKCITESYSVRFDFNPIVCALNKAIPETVLGKKHNVPNCQQFGYDSVKGLKCNICNSGFYNTDDGKNCLKETTPNCLIYNINPTNKAVTCIKCKNTFYLDPNGLCFEGTIKGCLEYTNKENCLTCSPNHMATRINFNQYTICMDVTSSVSNCLNFDVENGYTGVLNCLKCSNTTFPIAFDLPVKTCAKFYPISNCLEYDIRETFSASTFFCLRCTEPYFVTPGVFPSTCIRRANYPISHCLNYSTTSDFCLGCLPNFFIAANKLSCQPNPAGIQGCREYTSFSECKNCIESYFPFNKTCSKVPQVKIVSNCYTYSPELSCLKCQREFVLRSEVCVASVVLSCLVAGFDGKCEECIPGVQKINDGCEKSSLLNCKVYDSISSCKICKSGYYLVSGSCFEPAPIEQCVEYDSKTTCFKCEQGLLIESNQSKCLPLTETLAEYKNLNCEKYERKSSCIACDYNYYFNSDLGCISCKTERAKCRFCDYRNSSQCLMCESGYHMTSQLACEKDTNTTSSSNATKIDNISDDYLVDNGANRFGLVSFLALFMLNFGMRW